MNIAFYCLGSEDHLRYISDILLQQFQIWKLGSVEVINISDDKGEFLYENSSTRENADYRFLFCGSLTEQGGRRIHREIPLSVLVVPESLKEELEQFVLLPVFQRGHLLYLFCDYYEPQIQIGDRLCREFHFPWADCMSIPKYPAMRDERFRTRACQPREKGTGNLYWEWFTQAVYQSLHKMLAAIEEVKRQQNGEIYERNI